MEEEEEENSDEDKQTEEDREGGRARCECVRMSERLRTRLSQVRFQMIIEGT